MSSDHQPHQQAGSIPDDLTLFCLPSRDYFYIQHNGEQFRRDLVEPIKALGYDQTTATHYARLIAKNPCRDQAGRIAVVEDGCDLKILALLNLDLFPKGEVITLDGDGPV